MAVDRLLQTCLQTQLYNYVTIVLMHNHVTSAAFYVQSNSSLSLIGLQQDATRS